MHVLFQVAIQACGCSEMSAEELNHMLMGLAVGANKMVGCWEFVAAVISPAKMLRGGYFLQVRPFSWNEVGTLDCAFRGYLLCAHTAAV